MPPEAWLQDFDAALRGEADAVAQKRLLAQWGDPAQLNAALADVAWLSARLREAPKPELPAALASRIHAALQPVEALPLAACEREGAAPYLLGHDPDDLEPGEAERLAFAFGDEESSDLALAQLDAISLALRDAPPPPPMPANLLSRIRLALDEEPLPAASSLPGGQLAMGQPRLASSADEDWDATLPAWAEEACAHVGLASSAIGPEAALAAAQMEAIRKLMAEAPKPALPQDLALRLHKALANEGGHRAMDTSRSAEFLAKAPVAWFRRPWATGLAGAMAAALAVFFLAPLGTNELPRIETAAVAARTDVAVNIGFDVESDLEGVTFQIDLPEGLKFLDDKRQPILAQSVSWRGSLKAGRTVVPIHVQGVRPGRYEIEAFVRKGQMMRKTTILLPVTPAAPEG